MSQNYTESMKIGSQSLGMSATQLTAPTLTEEQAVVTLLVASASAFKYSDASSGTYRDAVLNSASAMYEKRFPIQNPFSQLWFKSAAGTITVSWEALVNRRAWASK